MTYWLREGRTGNAEVDYLFAYRGTIIPIEVKSGKIGTLKSLHQFVADHATPRAIRLDLNPGSQQQIPVHSSSKTKNKFFTLYSFPIYCTGQLEKMLPQIG